MRRHPWWTAAAAVTVSLGGTAATLSYFRRPAAAPPATAPIDPMKRWENFPILAPTHALRQGTKLMDYMATLHAQALDANGQQKTILHDGKATPLSLLADRPQIVTYDRMPTVEFLWPRYQNGDLTAHFIRNVDCHCAVYFDLDRRDGETLTMTPIPLAVQANVTFQPSNDFLGLQPLYDGPRIQPLVITVLNGEIKASWPSLTMEYEGAISFVNFHQTARQLESDVDFWRRALAKNARVATSDALTPVALESLRTHFTAFIPKDAVMPQAIAERVANRVTLEAAHQQQLDYVSPSTIALHRALTRLLPKNNSAPNQTALDLALNLQADLAVIRNLLDEKDEAQRNARVGRAILERLASDLINPTTATPIVSNGEAMSGVLLWQATRFDEHGKMHVDVEKARKSIDELAQQCQRYLIIVDQYLMKPGCAHFLGMTLQEFDAFAAAQVADYRTRKNLCHREAAISFWMDLRYVMHVDAGDIGNSTLTAFAQMTNDAETGTFQKMALEKLGLQVESSEELRRKLLQP